jgi:hypothetical protein
MAKALPPKFTIYEELASGTQPQLYRFALNTIEAVDMEFMGWGVKLLKGCMELRKKNFWI